MGKQRVGLEDHADIALVRGHVGDVLAADQDPPEVGVSKPAIMRSVVVLPQPDGPSKATNSPGSDSEIDAIDHPRLAVEALFDAFEPDVGAVGAVGKSLMRADGGLSSRRMRVTRASISSLRSLSHFQSTWISCATFASVL